MQENDMLFLGLDSSTQSLKAIVMDQGLKVVYTASVNFDTDLPEFGTEGGVHHGPDGLTVTSPTIMWVAALDLLLKKMAEDRFDFAKVAAVSGSGQQHGSVYMKTGGIKALNGLTAGNSLRSQLEECFSIPDSPIWMDSSTGQQCKMLESALGGAQAVADLTGSRAYERFTGNQIAKMFQTKRQGYEDSERILLVSSFMASLLVGDYVPIDASDGSGMNLMDLRSKTWNRQAIDATAPGLEQKLGQIVPSHSVAGPIHSYYRDLCGFTRDCLVICFSGDNPNSLAGLRLQRAGDIAISLGTSDTMFGSLASPTPSASEGHIFANPVDPNGYMAMVCQKNGSLTRERVRDEFAGGTWDAFEKALARTPAGNNGNVGFYIDEPEITPPLLQTGVFRFDASGTRLDSFAPDLDARAVVESQFLSLLVHGSNIGLKPAGILATGGASTNKSITTIMSNVFGVPVYAGEQPDSAALGACYRALHGWQCNAAQAFVPFADTVKGAPKIQQVATPNAAAHAAYSAMLDHYRALEGSLV
jgi:xylulokinase